MNNVLDFREGHVVPRLHSYWASGYININKAKLEIYKVTTDNHSHLIKHIYKCPVIPFQMEQCWEF